MEILSIDHAYIPSKCQMFDRGCASEPHSSATFLLADDFEVTLTTPPLHFCGTDCGFVLPACSGYSKRTAHLEIRLLSDMTQISPD